MAARLQMKLGVVAQHDRLPDSPDTIVVVEPTVGSIARSKGSLYLLVTSRLGGARAQEATRLAAETIRNEYYYNESAGIRGCLEKAIAVANRRLTTGRERLELGDPDQRHGPIGVGVAVVRGSELYVATVGPVDVYLVRQARLSTLPDRDRDRGLPAVRVDPGVWRGEIETGDSVVLVSPNVVDRLGTGELKDALVTLHPQSAMEHLHRRFVAAEGSGSDGAVAFEATEVPGGSRLPFVADRADEARARDARPSRAEAAVVPLAEAAAAGVSALEAGGRQARAAAENAFERAVAPLQDLLGPTPRSHRRVRPRSRRRETQLRAAVALLAFVVVTGGLAAAVLLAPEDRGPSGPPPSIIAGQRALEAARANVSRVFGRGADLVEDDPRQARQLLTQAYEDLARAEAAGVSRARIRPLREQVVAGLDRLFGVVIVDDELLFTFEAEAHPGTDLADLVQGPDGVPYVLDRGAGNAVWRYRQEDGTVSAPLQAGASVDDATVDEPLRLAVGGQDLVILDASRALWRWKPTDPSGEGVPSRIHISGADQWGSDIAAIGTYLRDPDRGLYNLYVVDPSAQQIRAYAPASDGAGFPSGPENWLNARRPLDEVTDLYIDGDLYVAIGGQIIRFSAGADDQWEPESPGDELIRPAPRYRYLASATSRRAGRLYAFDDAHDRVVSFEKGDGSFVEQYRLAPGNSGWSDVRGMYVVESEAEAPRLVWTTGDRIHVSVLAPLEPEEPADTDAPGEPPASGEPEPDASGPTALRP